MLQAGERVVVQIHVRHRDVVRQALRIHIEVVVLGRDLDFACLQVLDRMIAAMVAELELVGLAAQREAEQLMSQTDAEQGRLALQLADGVLGILQRLWVARAVGEEDPVRMQRQYVGGGRLRRHNRHAAVLPSQHAQNILLDAEVIGHHVHRLPSGRVVKRQQLIPSPIALVGGCPLIRLLRAHDTRQVGAVHGAMGTRFGDQRLDIGHVGR